MVCTLAVKQCVWACLCMYVCVGWVSWCVCVCVCVCLYVWWCHICVREAEWGAAKMLEHSPPPSPSYHLPSSLCVCGVCVCVSVCVWPKNLFSSIFRPRGAFRASPEIKHVDWGLSHTHTHIHSLVYVHTHTLTTHIWEWCCTIQILAEIWLARKVSSLYSWVRVEKSSAYVLNQFNLTFQFDRNTIMTNKSDYKNKLVTSNFFLTAFTFENW